MDIRGLLQDPVFLQGAGLLINKGRPEGLLQGAQLAESASRRKMQQQQYEDEQKKREEERKMMEQRRMLSQQFAEQYGIPTGVMEAFPDVAEKYVASQIMPEKPSYTTGYKDFLMSQENPDYGDFLMAQKKAGATNVNVPVYTGGNVPLTKTQESKTQSDVIKGIQDIESLKSISNSFSDDYLTYAGQAKKFGLGLADKVGLDIGKEGKDYLGGATDFFTQVDQAFNVYRKEITGAAAAESELSRLKKTFINGDMSPTEFKAAFNSWASRVQNALKTNQSFVTSGLPTKAPQSPEINTKALNEMSDEELLKALNGK